MVKGLAKRKRRQQRSRSWGAVLDGGFLSWARVEDGQAVDHAQLVSSDNTKALKAWLSQIDPKEPVTVSVLSRAQEFTSIELPSDAPPVQLANLIESTSAKQFRTNAGAYSVVACLDDATGGTKVPAHVFGIPESEMKELWEVTADRPSLRFTLPAMTVGIDGVHMVVYPTTAELLAVVGGKTKATFGLRESMPQNWREAPDSPEVVVYAEQVADHAHLAIQTWVSKRVVGKAVRTIHLTGPGALVPALSQALARYGYQATMDYVSPSIDFAPLLAADGARGALAVQAGLAAAAAVADLGKVGVLQPPGRNGPKIVTAKDFREAASPQLKKATVGATIAMALLVLAGTVLPRVLGARDLSNAQAQVAAAKQQIATLRPDIAIWADNHKLSMAAANAERVPWQTLIDAIGATIPQGIAISSMTLTATGRVVKVSVTATANPPTTLPMWMGNLEVKKLAPVVTGFTDNVTTTPQGGVTGTGSPTAPTSTATGAAHFVMTFSVTKDFN